MENESTSTEKPTTRAVGLKFGLFSALAGILLFVVAIVMNANPFKGVFNWIGFAIGIALVVLAHKKFKDDGDGYMEYSQGVGIGFWIGVASLISIPFMYVYLNYVDSAPFDLFLQNQEDEMINSGAPENIIETSMKWTKKLFWPIALVMGILGSVVTALIVAIFTKKANPEMPN
jgi:Protein of unknown function (DUF4199)